MRRVYFSLAFALLASASVCALGGCNTYSTSLIRSREAFEQNQHERALAILRALEIDEPHLTSTEQSEYAYLRGMTDYRIGYLQDARHWLSVAKALDVANPKALNDDWKQRMTQVLAELNKQVYEEGLDSLSNAQASQGKDDDADDSKAPKKKSRTDGAKKNDGAAKPADAPKPDKADKPKSDDTP